MNDAAAPDRARQLRRWGPIGLLAVIVIVVAIVLVSGGDDDTDTVDPTPTGDTTPDGSTPNGSTPTGTDDPAADGIVTWAEAEEAGITDTIEWGDRCDTERGTLAVPFFFAAACVAPFEGDNGGETAPGVTADTIKVVVYLGPEVDPVLDFITGPINNDDTPDDIFATYQGQVDYYSAYFELYGREIELIRYDATGASQDEVAAIADAETIARDIRPFMVWGAPTLAADAFAKTLAANEVMCSCLGGVTARDNYPYLHDVSISAEQSRAHLAEYIGKRLAGDDAVHSGDFVDQERVFAYLYLETSDVSTQVAEDFRDDLAEQYGVELVEMIPYELDPGTLQEQATTRIATLKEAGVTSIIFAGDPVAPRDFTLAATEQEYFPEWILAGSALVDTNVFARTYDQEQWRHAFGMSNTAARIDRRKSGFFFLYEWFNGEEPPAGDTIGVMWQPSLMFPTLQGTGPDLTPDTYAATLVNADPTARGALTQPSLSFGDKGLWPEQMLPDMNGIDDVSEIWWNPDTEGVDELDRVGNGMYWFVDGGTRYLPGEWPDTPPKAFDEEGAVFFYDEVPEEEFPPQYPSPAG